MSTSRLEHMGHQIEIAERDDGAEITIDGKAVEVLRDSDSGQFISPELPYRTYESAEALAKSAAEERR